MASSISRERWPKSVAWTRTALPRSSRNPMGSRASWGVRNGVTVTVPMRRLSPGTSESQSGVSDPFFDVRHRQVPSVQATGIPCRAAKVVALRQWSPCSWETSTAAMSDGLRPASAIRFSRPRQERPASTSRVVGPPEIRAAFPELPEPRIRRLISMGRNLRKERRIWGFGGAQTTTRPLDPSTPEPQHLGVPYTSNHNRLWKGGNAGLQTGTAPRRGAKGVQPICVTASRRGNADLRSARAGWRPAQRRIAALPHRMRASERRPLVGTASRRLAQPAYCCSRGWIRRVGNAGLQTGTARREARETAHR